MDCASARETVQLSFGTDNLPKELKNHLQDCQPCRAYRDELAPLAGRLGRDDAFVLSKADLDRTVHKVDNAIKGHCTISAKSFTWLRPLARVAALLLIVGAIYSSRTELNWPGQKADLSDIPGPNEPTVADWDDTSEEEMDEGFVSILIDDYSSSGYFEAGETLLGDISEEELEYLVENFEVGELL